MLVEPGHYVEAVRIPAGVSLVSTQGRDSTYISSDSTPVRFLPVPPSAAGSGIPTVCRGFGLGHFDSFAQAIVITENPDAIVEDCSVTDGFGTDSSWALFYVGRDLTIRNCRLRHTGQEPMSWTVTPGTAVLVEDCVIEKGLTGDFGLHSQESGVHLLFRNNTIFSSIRLATTGSDSDFTVEFVNNIFSNGALVGGVGQNQTIPDSVSYRFNVYWDSSFPNGTEEFFVNGVGNFEADPLFCEGPLTYWLEPESPCIGAGETGENIGARFGVCDVASTPETPPLDFVRSQVHVWPNPSTGCVEIVLAGDLDATDLDAAVFGIDGRRLATLNRGAQTGSMNWDGEVDGKAVPNGSYVVVLQRGNTVVATERFVLAR